MKKMYFTIVSCSILALMTGCANQAGYRPSPQQTLEQLSYQQMDINAGVVKKRLTEVSEEKVFEEVKTKIRNGLKDPASAQFQNVRLVDHPNGKIVCGEVNGKNSYGGYVGYKKFYGSLIDSYVEEQGGKYPEIARKNNTALNTYCGY